MSQTARRVSCYLTTGVSQVLGRSLLNRSSIEVVSATVVAVREAWLDAVAACDAARIAELVTEDVVVVHGNGRCVRGRDEVKLDFEKGFKAFHIEQTVLDSDLVTRNGWAIETAEIETYLRPRAGGESTKIRSITVTVLRRQQDDSWKVVRVLGLFD